MNEKLQKEETLDRIAYRSRFGRCVDLPYGSLCDDDDDDDDDVDLRPYYS